VNAQSKVMTRDVGSRCNIMLFKSAPELAKPSWVAPDPDPRALLRTMVVGDLDLFHDAETGSYRFRQGERTIAIASSIQTCAAHWLLALGLVEACAEEKGILYLPTAEGRRVGADRNSLMTIDES
jgi:hypothetical protein